MLYVDIGSRGGINPTFIDEFEGARFIACDPLDDQSLKNKKEIESRGGVD